MTIGSITQAIQQSGFLTSEHVYRINSLLMQRQYSEADLQALDQLIEDLIACQVQSTSPVVNLFLAEI